MKDKINYKKVNEVVSLTSKILNLVYIAMIIGIIFIATLLIKEWGILKFVMTILKVATPFFIGFVIAWLFNPLVVKLENRGWNRAVASMVIFLVFILIIFAFFSMLIPTIYTQLNDLIASLPGIFNSLKNWITNFLNNFNSSDMVDVASIEANIFKSMEDLGTNITTNLPSMIMNIVGVVFSGLGTMAISLVVGLYLLFDFNNATDHLLKYIPKTHKYEIETLINQIGEELRKCVRGTLTIACMVFVCDSLGFALAGLKAPILFGLLCGITDLIPYIGPYIGGAAAVIVGFSQNPMTGIIVLSVAVIVQLIENYVLQPVVMSKTVELHPVTIIIGLLIFGHFFGIIGMILAMPIMSLIKVVYRFFATKYDWFNSDIF
ncbi:MAG: AI-2E family transporter [Bacilli bacterium]|nr:AI-2E family transporter [Bacilli bacterium]